MRQSRSQDAEVYTNYTVCIQYNKQIHSLIVILKFEVKIKTAIVFRKIVMCCNNSAFGTPFLQNSEQLISEQKLIMFTSLNSSVITIKYKKKCKNKE